MFPQTCHALVRLLTGGRPYRWVGNPRPAVLVAAAPAAGCVTGSVTIRSERDDQDTTGRAPVIEPYPARRAEFRGKSRFLKNGGSGFQDRRHRPLGHPSASKCRQNSRGSPFGQLTDWPCVTGSVTVASTGQTPVIAPLYRPLARAARTEPATPGLVIMERPAPIRGHPDPEIVPCS